MRDDMTINSTVKKRGNAYCIPMTKRDKEILGIEEGDDLEVKIIVRQRYGR